MEKLVIKGRWREELGSRASKRLRAQGWVPAVLYGKKNESPLHMSFPTEDVDKILRSHTKLIEVDLGDGKTETGLIKEVQIDSVTDNVLHIDLVHVDLTKPVEVTVELEFIGHPKGVKEGGKFSQDISDLPLICLPTQIPESIPVRIGDLEVGQHITAGDLELPEGVKLGIPPETVICHVKAFIPGVESEEGVPSEEPTEPEVIGKKEKKEETEEGS